MPPLDGTRPEGTGCPVPVRCVQLDVRVPAGSTSPAASPARNTMRGKAGRNEHPDTQIYQIQCIVKILFIVSVHETGCRNRKSFQLKVWKQYFNHRRKVVNTNGKEAILNTVEGKIKCHLKL